MGISKLAEITAKRAWLTILLWVLATSASGFFISQYLASGLTTSQSVETEIEAEKAFDIISERLDGAGTEGGSELVIIKSPTYKITDPAFQQFTLSVQEEIGKLPDNLVENTISYYQTQNSDLVSENQNATLIIVVLAAEATRDDIEQIREIVTEKSEDENFDVYQSGTASVNRDFEELAEKDLQQAEFIGIPIALLVLIIVFGAVTAAFIPVILAFLAIALATAASALLGQVYQLSFFVTNMITMMGLAVGIDYSLFVISRFREERSAGIEKHQAIKIAAATASRAVFFSGVTVVVALAGLLLIPSNVFRSLSIGAIFVVIAAVFAALTLLPAILSILGDKINFLSLPFIGRNQGKVSETGFWNKVAGLVMRNPIVSLELSAGILLLATIPIFALNIGSSGASSLPDELPSKAGFEILENEFSSGLLSPTKIVIDGDVVDPAVANSISDLEASLVEKDFIAAAHTQIHPEQNIAVMDVILDATAEEGEKAIEEIRASSEINELKEAGLGVYVGGREAENFDFTQIIRDYTPLVFAFVLSLSFLFLMVVFRSIVVPIKAIIMNLLSVGAAYGLMVLVFEKGVGAEFLGFQQTGQIESWIPIFLFAILFGLSMDYHVFLLSRIREKFIQTKDNTQSVIFGLATTGRLITGAALIMVVVFAGFASGSLVMFQQVGFGLAVAILLDATIVRSVLVPASMKLLGEANWYLPSWLAWLPKIGIES